MPSQASGLEQIALGYDLAKNVKPAQSGCDASIPPSSIQESIVAAPMWDVVSRYKTRAETSRSNGCPDDARQPFSSDHLLRSQCLSSAFIAHTAFTPHTASSACAGVRLYARTALPAGHAKTNGIALQVHYARFRLSAPKSPRSPLSLLIVKHSPL